MTDDTTRYCRYCGDEIVFRGGTHHPYHVNKSGWECYRARQGETSGGSGSGRTRSGGGKSKAA